jgi:hypothetical protein
VGWKRREKYDSTRFLWKARKDSEEKEVTWKEVTGMEKAEGSVRMHISTKTNEI